MDLLLSPFRALRDSVEFIGGWGYLIGDTLHAMPRALLARRGRRMGWANVWAQMNRVGVKSIPIVSLVLFCIGAILAFQMAPTLKDLGLVARVADIIGIAVYRELGPLVAAIVLTGFAGASIAAEIGTMVISEEIQALQAHAIPPIRFLAVPRILSTVVMMVCLAVLADLMGTLGGLVVGQVWLDIGWRQYLARTFSILTVFDFLTGLIKAGVFGMLISSLACYLGLSVSGGSEGVGVATTRTVVLTIVALIGTDLLFTAAFFFLGL